MDLKNKVALITGSGRGIGKGIALHLAECGADVIVNYHSSESGALDIVNQIQSIGRRVIAIKADVSSVREIHEMVGRVKETFGTIDILVNNSAIDPTVNFFDVTEDLWGRVMDTNLKGSFFCAQACAKEMALKGGGKIINISSVHGLLTMPKYSAYSSSKGGVNAMTRQLALDLASCNIQVNAISPGATEVEKFMESPLYDKRKIGVQIPAGRIGEPLDVAKVVAFLASSNSDFVTGQIITVDGGSSTRFFLSSDD